MNRIIIIGGMGPQASLELHKQIIAHATLNGAELNNDFPEIVHISIPIRDFINADEIDSAIQHINGSLSTIVFKPSDIVVLACNTAHLVAPQIKQISDSCFISLIDIAVTAIRPGVHKVGILASPTLLKNGIHKKTLSRRSVKFMHPNSSELANLESSIRNIISGKPIPDERDKVLKIVYRMLSGGADQIVLGCTELSVMFAGVESRYFIDPLKIAGEIAFENAIK